MDTRKKKQQIRLENKKKIRRRTRRKQKRRKQEFLVRVVFSLLILSVFTLIGGFTLTKVRLSNNRACNKVIEERPELNVDLLTVNEFSRPGNALNKVNGIVVHYTANPGTGAEQNRDYFEGLKDSKQTHASSHFVIGLQGEIVQCIPCDEISYASNDRNEDTISIECCIPDETGKFDDMTYQSLVQLTAWLCTRYGLTSENVIRHYDVTGKLCPKYYVEHEDAWIQFKSDVDAYITANGVEQ